MEKRAFERITVSVQANFFYGKTMYSGMVTNISQKGMYIKIDVCPHFESKFELLLPFKDEVLKELNYKVLRTREFIKLISKVDSHE